MAKMNDDIKISRAWAMPSKNTFGIKPVDNLLHRYISPFHTLVDPFANSYRYPCLTTITNDIDPQYDTDYHMDATEFLKTLPDKCCNIVLYDPPFSPRQVSECYKKFGMSVNMETTQASYWSKQKEQIARIVKHNGYVITCGWNSGGIGQKYGFEIQRILLVPHGGWHNDTICVVETKVI